MVHVDGTLIGEGLGREVRIVLGVIIDQALRQSGKVTGRGQLPGIGQAGGVAEGGAGHAQLAGTIGHHPGEIRLTAAHGFGQHHGAIIGGLLKKKFVIGGKKETYRDLQSELMQRVIIK